MRLLWLLLLPALVRGAEKKLWIHKCCDTYKMLSGDGGSCVAAPWPRDAVPQWRLLNGSLQLAMRRAPFVRWVARWLPPGLAPERVWKVSTRYLNFAGGRFTKSLPWAARASPVQASSEWLEGGEEGGPRELLDESVSDARGRVVFARGGTFIMRIPEARQLPRMEQWRYESAPFYCVDAARPPLAPFALVTQNLCQNEGCYVKCCNPGLVATAETGGEWRCVKDARGYWSPTNSSFARFFDKQTPFNNRGNSTCFERIWAPPREYRLSPEDPWVPQLLQRRVHHFLFSSWDTCVDWQLGDNDALTETLFYCEYSRITRAFYWLLRPLCFVSVALLATALAAVACNSGMRSKAHGWCLACHAACLLGFNLGQVAYYMTLSDEIDSFGVVPQHLMNTCKNLAFPMFFLMTAAICWLTALCFNMSLGFGKLQVTRPKAGKEWKRFLVMSAAAWGLPSLMTALCAYAFEKDHLLRKWSSPSLTETRTCFNEIVLTTRQYGFLWMSLRHKSGSAIFYFGPASALLVANAVCVARVLRKVQFLRRGNSVLHREDDEVARGRRQADGQDPRAGNTRSKKTARSTSLDAKTLWMYVKMLLMSGAVEVFTETTGWAISAFDNNTHFALTDYALAYRATGYVIDCFRAVCVAWLAAPDGGYLAALRRRLGGGERRAEAGRGRGAGQVRGAAGSGTRRGNGR